MIINDVKVGDKIKVINEYPSGWREQPYPIDSEWKVRRVLNQAKGLVACNGNEFCISSRDYVVIENS